MYEWRSTIVNDSDDENIMGTSTLYNLHGPEFIQELDLKAHRQHINLHFEAVRDSMGKQYSLPGEDHLRRYNKIPPIHPAKFHSDINEDKTQVIYPEHTEDDAIMDITHKFSKIGMRCQVYNKCVMTDLTQENIERQKRLESSKLVWLQYQCKKHTQRHKKELLRLQKHCQKIKRYVKSKNFKMKFKQKKIDSCSSKLVEQVANEEFKKIETKCMHLQQELIKERKHKEDLEVRLQEKKATTAEFVEKIDKYKEKLDKHTEYIEKQKNNQKNNNTTLEEIKMHYEGIIEDISSKFKHSEKSLIHKEKQVLELQNRIEQIIKAHSLEIEEKEKELNEAISHLKLQENTSQPFSISETELGLLQEENSTVTDERNEAWRKITELNNAMITKERQIKELNSNFDQIKWSHKGAQDEKEEAIKELLEDIENLKLQIKIAKADIPKELRELKEEIEEKTGIINVLTVERNDAWQKITQISNDMKDVMTEKDRTIEYLTLRLSAEMSNKVSSDERNLENVSIKNRPMNITQEYEHLCSNQWLNAKTELDKRLGSQEVKIRILCSIFMEAEVAANKLYKENMAKLQEILNNPFSSDIHTLHATVSEEIPQFVRNAVGDFMRNNSERVDVSPLKQIVIRKVIADQSELSDAFNSKAVSQFLSDCLKLCWNMVLQRPPMAFKQEGIGERWMGENKQDPFWGSLDPDDPRNVVKYFVHPALYHKQALMTKAKVYIATA